MTVGLAERAIVQAVAERGSPDLLMKRVWPGYQFHPHSVLIADAVRRCLLKPNGRLIIAMAPRYGKTQMVLRAGPLYALELWPAEHNIAATYGSALSLRHSRWVRNQIDRQPDRLTVRLDPSSTAADQFETTAGGGLLATSTGGSIVGFGAQRGLFLDDLLKGWAEARSWAARQRAWEWLQTDAWSRLESRASVIVSGSRLHPDDITGRLLEQDAAGVGEGWEVLSLPTLAIEGEVDPLGRRPGEVLCPAMFGPAEVEAIRRGRAMEFEAMWQQRPTHREGSLFRRSAWKTVDRLPDGCLLVRGWDLAATEGGGDWTVGVLMALHPPTAAVFVVDVIREQLAPAGVEELLARTARADAERYGRGLRIVVEREGGASGKAWAESLVKRVLSGHAAKAQAPSGSKQDRALGFSAQVEVGNVAFVKRWDPDAGGEGVGGFVIPAWADLYVEELAGVEEELLPEHDDQLDASSAAFNELTGKAPKGKAKVRVTRPRGSIGDAGLPPAGVG